MLGGLVESLNGGDFGHGMMSAGLSKVIGLGVDGATEGLGEGLKAIAIKVTIQAIAGGTVSAATGGDFANGAVSAALQFAFNQLLSKGRSAVGQADDREMADAALVEKARAAVDIVGFNPNDPRDRPFFVSLSNYKKMPDEIVVAAHGTETQINIWEWSNSQHKLVDMTYFDTRQLGYRLRELPNYKTAKTIRLLVCNTGAGEYARFLAIDTGKNVIAPNGGAFYRANGEVYASKGQFIDGPKGKPRSYVDTGVSRQFINFAPK
jgi:hypothetical protein